MNSTREAMAWLGEQPDTLFLGQGVAYPGTKMSASFEGVPDEKRIEMPVAEQLQLGISIGLALEGFVPISVFPRINFLLCAMDMLVNHLDKLPLYSDYQPKVIIRTAVGAKRPLDAGPQHTGDYTLPLAEMLKSVKVARLYSPATESDRWLLFLRTSGPAERTTPIETYRTAYARKSSSLIVEG